MLQSPAAMQVPQLVLKNDHPQTNRSPAMKARLSRDYWGELRKSKKGLTGAFLMVLFITIGVFAPWIAPKSTTEQNPDYRFALQLFFLAGRLTTC